MYFYVLIITNLQITITKTNKLNTARLYTKMTNNDDIKQS